MREPPHQASSLFLFTRRRHLPLPSSLFVGLLRQRCDARTGAPPCLLGRDPSLPSSIAAGMAAVTAVEHLVLFKVRDGTDPAKVDAMVSNLRSLASLDVVLHLAAPAIIRCRSPAAAALGFTHLLHSRYRTKPDLAAYAAHPAHLSVVREFVLPICDDIMAFDWVGHLGSGPVALRPGSVARVTLAKLREGAGEEEKADVMAALGGFQGSFPGVVVEQFSYGENFSPARAKGFSVGSIAVFAGPEELDGLEANGGDLLEAHKEKARALLESIIVVDFVVPPQPAVASGL
uniref:Stress-response A/B barrel domain-containing protein n=1 Tax=Anthurium amnicola TaxID=1678845 RepID=A0A1D1YI34_9ARAE